MKKLVIIVTVPVVLETWLKGQAKFLSQYYKVEIITAPSETINSIKLYENVSIVTMDFNRQINLFKDLKVLWQLVRYFLKEKPSMVYTLTPKAGLLGMIASWIARVRYRIHCVVGLPHLEAKGNRKTILSLTEKITYFFASNIFCNSLNLKKVVSSMSTKPVNVIGNGSVNGVDTEFFKDKFSVEKKQRTLEKIGFRENHFIITFVGRIVKDKGINELIQAFYALSQEYEEARLLLIGDYKNESDPISMESVDIIEKNSKIKYLEFQEDVREYLAISNLFVLPSYREGLPNVLIEAGSYGVPMIATDINGCNEVIENNVNGLLVKKKDVGALYYAMQKFVDDTSFYESIQMNVRKSIVTKYNQQYFWSELLHEFQKIESVK